VNALAANLLDAETLTELRGWLDGGAPLPGLTVDTDLRWRLLRSLVAHGAATDAEIEAEVQRDPTATGQRQAAATRSIRPTPEAKAEAWYKATADDELPNAISDSVIAGFAHHAQKGLLAEYVDKYFADVADVWRRRSSERAQPTVLGLFPSWAVAPSTVEAADRWLADDHPSALRRLVSEGRAGIVRALAAQEFDRL
jgi:aminopeptidase N